MAKITYLFMKKKILFYFLMFLLLFLVIRLFDFALSKTVFAMDSAYYVYPKGYYANKTPDGDSFVKINSLGIRSEELGDKGNRTRILFLGDSFTFGPYVEVEDTFVKSSEKKLRKDGYNIENINAGIIGYGPGHELGLYRALRDKIKPDVVVAVVYQNDINDAGETRLYKSMREHQMRKLLVWVAFALAPNTSNFFLRKFITQDFQEKIIKFANPVKQISEGELLAAKKRKSIELQIHKKTASPEEKQKIEFALRLMLSNYTQDTQLSPAEIQDWIEAAVEYIAKYGLGAVDTVQLMYGLFEPDYYKISANLEGDGGEYFNKFAEIMIRIKKESESRGEKFCIVFIPADVMYNREKSEASKTFHFKVDDQWLTAESKLEMKLEEFSRENSIPVLNLTSSFRAKAPDNYYTFPHDVHFNLQGHKIVSELIADFLEKNMLEHGK